MPGLPGNGAHRRKVDDLPALPWQGNGARAGTAIPGKGLRRNADPMQELDPTGGHRSIASARAKMLRIGRELDLSPRAEACPEPRRKIVGALRKGSIKQKEQDTCQQAAGN